MRLTDDQKKKYSAFMQDLWGLIKECGQPEQSNEYWQDVSDRATAISNKYNNDPIVRRILFGLLMGLEEGNEYEAD